MLDFKNSVIDNLTCSLPADESLLCPTVTCPETDDEPNCGAWPDVCPTDWKLRCVTDPCTCTSSIWLDEDVRITSQECVAAIQPQCVTTCPEEFYCEELSEFPADSGVECIQELCTCKPILDPSSVELFIWNQQQLYAQQLQQQQEEQIAKLISNPTFTDVLLRVSDDEQQMLVQWMLTIPENQQSSVITQLGSLSTQELSATIYQFAG